MRKNFLRTIILLSILALTLAMVVDTVDALVINGVRTWYWTDDTQIKSLSRGDVDSDGKIEIVTGGDYWDGSREVAQLCVWDGSMLALENVKTWYWTGNAYLNSIAINDVDGDGKNEVVTGGQTGVSAQLCVWDGATLTLENVQTWYWIYTTSIKSVVIGDVDGDGKSEIVTGGYYVNGTPSFNGFPQAQLCVWDGSTLALENIRTWYWTSSTYINSIAINDVDGDGKSEVVTGGYHWDGARNVAQLCVWKGATLELENVKTWYWISHTVINSLTVGDADGDGKTEIVTGGYFNDGVRYVAQLGVWNGATLALENVQSWYWTGSTIINSVALGDVEGDGKSEVTTGGYYNDGSHNVAQLCFWNGATLGLENVQTWYWTGNTVINSVVVGDVDGDGKDEAVTGGYYYDGIQNNAQLCVWAS